MIDHLLEELGKAGELSDWKIVRQRIESRELFFVGPRLDMNRSKEVTHTFLTTYQDYEQDGKPYRGSAEVKLPPSLDREEIREALRRSRFSARLVKNEPYPLVEPRGKVMEQKNPVPSGRALLDRLLPLVEAVFREDREGGGGINSVELFLNRVETRILNSRGIDVAHTGARGYIELISEWREGDEEVELYKEISFSELAPERLAEIARRQIFLSRDRAGAEPTPPLKTAAVLLTGDPVPEFFQYYLSQSAAENVYKHISQARVGASIQGEEVKGDAITLRLQPLLPGSPATAPFDADGFPLAPVSVIEEGMLRRLWGPLRFTHYLGVEPTGELANQEVKPGSRPAEELREGSDLEVLSFSDFHCDPVTGDFGGEIRLGYLGEGRKRRPVTGGSVSGNIRQVQGRLALSTETQILGTFSGPLALRLVGVSVSGCS